MGKLLVSDDLIDGHVRVLRAAGEADFDVAPQFKRRISSLIEAGDRRLVIDLTAVEFIDSTAIGVLVGTIKRMRSVGGALVVVCDNDDVRAIFEAVGLENVIPLHRSLKEARAGFAITA